MNQNLRAEDKADDCMIILEGVEEYIKNEQIFKEKTARRIGFYN